MFFHLGIPTFVSVINTGHLVASSRCSPHLDFDIKIWLNSSERSCQASHLAECVGMINVTNHLLTPRGQAFGLWPITLLHPAVFSLPLFSVETLYFALALVFSPQHYLSNNRYHATHLYTVFFAINRFSCSF